MLLFTRIPYSAPIPFPPLFLSLFSKDFVVPVGKLLLAPWNEGEKSKRRDIKDDLQRSTPFCFRRGTVIFARARVCDSRDLG